MRPGVVHVLEAVFIGLVSATMNYPTLLLRIPMVEVIHALFETCPHEKGERLFLCDGEQGHGYNSSLSLVMSLVAVAGLRLLQTAITFGAALPSGLFIPSIFIGALLGRSVGLATLEFRQLLFGMATARVHIEPGVFAMVGAVAMLSGFARMTVSLVVIMFELTGELTYVVPFMCAVLAAKQVGDMFTVSIYDGHASLLGFATIEEPEEFRLTPTVADVVDIVGQADVIEISAPVSMATLEALLRDRRLSPIGQDLTPLLRDEDMQPTVLGRQQLDASANGKDSDASAFPSPFSEPEGGTAETATFRSSSPRKKSPLCTPEALDLRKEREKDDLGGADAEFSTRERLGMLVLVKDSSKMVAHGVVEKWALRNWLKERQHHLGGISFEPVAADSVADVCGLRPLDASSLVETSIVRLQGSAPLLTAVCVFREHPVRFCVCRIGRGVAVSAGDEDGVMGVVSRRQLETRMSKPKFTAAFKLQTESFKDASGASRRATSADSQGKGWRGSIRRFWKRPEERKSLSEHREADSNVI